MKFDFLELYKNYTVKQLLEVVRNPDHYAPEAIEAANTLLQGRAVTEEEIVVVDEKRKREDAEWQPYGKTDHFLNSLDALIGPFLKPDQYPSGEKWIRALLAVMILHLISLVYPFVLHLFYSLQASGFESLFYYRWDTLISLGIALTFFILIFRKVRIGWILFLIYNMMLLCWNLKVVLQTLTLIYGMPPTDPGMNGIMVLLRVVLIMIMCREDVIALFRVDLRTRKRILVIVSIILTVALPFLMMLL